MIRQVFPRGLASAALVALLGFSFTEQAWAETQASEAQQESPGEVLASLLEQWIRSGFEFSWEGGQPMRAEVRKVWSQLGRGGTGYGFRTFQPRGGTAALNSSQASQGLLAGMERWHVTLDELHTSVVDEIGLVWGIYTEEFKAKGEPAETVRVRFTNTLRWDGQRWENLLYHRDVQLFDQNGKYLQREEACDPERLTSH